MNILGRSKKKGGKKEEEKVKAVVRQPSLLKVLCGEDKELYNALSYALLINSPEWILIEEVLEKASKKEEAGDLDGAGLEYRTAGQHSLFTGDVEGVKKYFGKAQELTGKEYLILKMPERAVSKAKEYYQKLQAEKTEKTEQTKH